MHELYDMDFVTLDGFLEAFYFWFLFCSLGY